LCWFWCCNRSRDLDWNSLPEGIGNQLQSRWWLVTIDDDLIVITDDAEDTDTAEERSTSPRKRPFLCVRDDDADAVNDNIYSRSGGGVDNNQCIAWLVV